MGFAEKVENNTQPTKAVKINLDLLIITRVKNK